MMSIFLPLFLATSLAHASTLDEVQRTWKMFRACAKQTEVENCAREYVDPTLPATSQSALIMFLDRDMVFSPLHECDESSPITPARPLAKGSYSFCMELPNLKKATYGYVIFTKHKDGTFKIKSIKYKL